jgi:predicted transcriptional regulator
MTMATCDNPRCVCEPCSCDGDCQCGAARLGDLERRVIAILWEHADGERSVKDVAALLPDHAYTTVATVLDRLVRKELVTRRTEGRRVLFTPTGSRADHAARAMADALLSAPNHEASLQSFVESLSSKDRRALRRALTGDGR